jgi:SAM-dependent methyltransferase
VIQQAETVNALPERCVCCGCGTFEGASVLWPELVEAWELTAREVEYVDLQQGWHCTACASNLRTMVLARAIVRVRGGAEPLTVFLRTAEAQRLRILEINEAGSLTQFLTALPHHVIVRYPEVEMHRLPFPPGSFDVVCHSDTLEHVEDPVGALRECRRVLAPGGALAYTIPIIVGRLSRGRAGLPASYHGDRTQETPDLLVHTEYGADAWREPFEAGFSECRIVALAPPAAHALVAVA